ncbi:MAG: hypothetical protein HY293_05565 [Planctomycetes bacterium]|nr:hypothetical protein [Planctomycetota bacterium]
MDIDRVQAEWVLGLLRPQGLPAFAAEALRQGFRGRFLSDLAELDHPRVLPEEVFDGALRELGREPITALQAARRLAREAALRILRDRTPPTAAAAEISRLLRRFDREEVPPELREFRWSTEPSPRKRSLADEQRIVELAWELIEE